MTPPGYGAGDIIAVSQLVAKVYAAYKKPQKIIEISVGRSSRFKS